MNQLSDRYVRNPNCPLGEADLSLPRRKKRSLIVSAAYRAFRWSRRCLGRERTLRFCLTGAWLLSRFAYEIWVEICNEDSRDVRLGLSKEFLAECVSPDARILDVGCGMGRWCRVASTLVHSVTGIDWDRAAIERARELSPQSNVDYVVGDASADLAEQLGHRKFDAALLVHVLEHIEDVDAFLATLRGVATKLLIEVPDFDADRLNIVRYAFGTRFYSDGDHVREYTASILRNQLERNGWHVVDEQHCHGSIVVVAREGAKVSSPTLTN
jgi:SAM-dependent methyltransferase